MKNYLLSKMGEVLNYLRTIKSRNFLFKNVSLILLLSLVITTTFPNLAIAKTKISYNQNLHENVFSSNTEMIKQNREFAKDRNLNKLEIKNGHYIYLTLSGDKNLKFLDGTDHLDEVGHCKNECKTMYVSVSQPIDIKSDSIITTYYACPNCTRNRTTQITGSQYLDSKERARLEEHCVELREFWKAIDKYENKNSNNDVLNSIKENRKFVLDNGIYVKKDGKNITSQVSVNDKIDVNSNGICKDNNHERTYAHYAYEGSNFYVRSGCFDCLNESYKLIEKSEYDDLEERIKLANTSERAKNFFIENNLSYTKDTKLKSDENFEIEKETIQKGKTLWEKTFIAKDNRWFNVEYFDNNVITVLTEIGKNSNDFAFLLYDIDTQKAQLRINTKSCDREEFDVKFSNNNELVLISRSTGKLYKTNISDLEDGKLQAIPEILLLSKFSPELIAGLTFCMIGIISYIPKVIEGFMILSHSMLQAVQNMSNSLKEYIDSILVKKVESGDMALNITNSLEREFDKKYKSSDKIKIYYPVKMINGVGFIINDAMTYKNARRRVNNGRDVFTPFIQSADVLATDLVNSYQNREKIQDYPHYNSRIYIRDLCNDNRYSYDEQRSESVRYNYYLQRDPLFVEANSNLYFAHYHVVNQENGDRPHILYFSTGYVEDFPEAIKGIELEYRNKISEFLSKYNSEIKKIIKYYNDML